MANRPVFIPCAEAPSFSVENIEFTWNKGLAVCQKQKNIRAIHDGFSQRNPSKTALEVSANRLRPEGVPFSAFRLKLDGIDAEKRYHAAKVVGHDGELAGPFPDILRAKTPRDAKRDPRIADPTVGYWCNGTLYPKDIHFYNRLYIQGLKSAPPQVSGVLFDYDGFTDIEYNPKGLNCQARACAIYVSPVRQGLPDQTDDLDRFRALLEQ